MELTDPQRKRIGTSTGGFFTLPTLNQYTLQLKTTNTFSFPKPASFSRSPPSLSRREKSHKLREVVISGSRLLQRGPATTAGPAIHRQGRAEKGREALKIKANAPEDKASGRHAASPRCKAFGRQQEPEGFSKQLNLQRRFNLRSGSSSARARPLQTTWQRIAVT